MSKRKKETPKIAECTPIPECTPRPEGAPKKELVTSNELFTIELCEPVQKQLRNVEICGPNITIKPCSPIKDMKDVTDLLWPLVNPRCVPRVTMAECTPRPECAPRHTGPECTPRPECAPRITKPTPKGECTPRPECAPRHT